MHTVAAIAGGLLATATHTAMRPFSYSVSPTRSETLTITAAPALGAQAQASPLPAGTPALKKSRVTDTYNADEPDPSKLRSHTEEQTLTSPPQAPPQTIYDIYQTFAHSPYLSHLSYQPREGYYVSGTLKKWSDKKGTEYYFIKDEEPDKKEYYEFCKSLFIKGSAGAVAGSLEQQVQELSGRVNTLNATPP